MKRYFIFFILFFFFISLLACHPVDDLNYRQLMRDFVHKISDYSKNVKSNFMVIPQNGVEIINEQYLSFIDGIGQEDFFYGYDGDDLPTPKDKREYLLQFINKAKEREKTILIIDYCETKNYVDDSYSQNNKLGFISFAADHRELDNIPAYPLEPYNSNSEDIKSLNEAKNFLYIINPYSFNSKDDFINTLKKTNFDIIVIDLFFNDQILTKDDVASLKKKANNKERLIICYMSIGEAEDYRYYWQESWNKNPPSFIEEENPDWPGNYKVRYWYPSWQSIIFGNDDSYLNKILAANFDGVYLDIIDAYKYFESK